MSKSPAEGRARTGVATSKEITALTPSVPGPQRALRLENVRGSRAHQKYYLSDGTLVPGVTTVLGILAKPALVPWANKLGLQGINVTDYVDGLASVGKAAHTMVEAHLADHEPDLSDYSPREVGQAENAVLSYFEWARGKDISPILLEHQLVSEKYRFGGTIDAYMRIDGELCLVDFKTAKAIYPEHLIQVAAYRQLLEERGLEVSSVRILQIGRDETERFSERVLTDTSDQWELFSHALSIYQLQKKIEKAKANR